MAPKTILEVHMIVRAALNLALERELVIGNVAHGARARRRPPTRAAARSWNAEELRRLLAEARRHRLYPALHLAAHTGMRRGEVVGLKWSDLNRGDSRLSISWTLQSLAGRPVEFGEKTAPVAAQLNSTKERFACSLVGVGASPPKAFRTDPMTGCSAQHRPLPQPRVRQPTV